VSVVAKPESPLPPGPPLRDWFDMWSKLLTGKKMWSPPEYMLHLIGKYGDVTRYWGPYFPIFCIANPEYVKEILTKAWPHYVKGTIDYKVVGAVLGNGLVTNDGPHWASQRRLMQPVFGNRSTNQFGQVINEMAEDLAQQWENYDSDRIIQLDQEMSRITFQVVSRTLFGTNIDHVADEMVEILDLVNQNPMKLESLFRLWPNLPLPGNSAFRKVKQRLNDIVDNLVDDHRNEGKTDGDIVDRLIAARNEEDGSSMTNEQMRDEIITLMLAGHETSATALTWTFYLLSQNPEVENSLREELLSTLKGSSADAKDLAELPYLKQVVQESMRIYPPVWGIARKSADETKFNGYRIPKNSYIAISIFGLHRHPDFWHKPEEFDPSRFDSSQQQSRHSYSYLPFAAGPRACIGASMAMLEVQLVLARLLQSFKVTPVPNHPIEPLPVVTLKQRYGMPVMLEKI